MKTLAHRLFALLIAGVVNIHCVAADPQWIWSARDRDGAGEQAEFHRDFHLDRPIGSATLTCLGDSARFQVRLNGRLIHHQSAYASISRLNVRDFLRRGDNRIEVLAESVAGPSAVLLDLQVGFSDGASFRLASDSSWRVNGKDAPSFGRADPRLLVQKERAVGVSAVDNYEQWKLALGEGVSAAKLSAAPDFEVALVRSAAAKEGSWVSLAFDPQGRAVIAKEKVGLLRLSFDDSGGVTQVEAIEDTLKECRGLLFAHGYLYANANNSKALYRMKLDGDQLGEPELLLSTDGGVGHGRNDLALGPDGKVYSIHGDAVRIPKSGRDYTSPYRDARRGKSTSEGHLVRFDPKSKQVEVLAAGLRNPFGIDFNTQGDAFTYDADAEFDMGAPWYRPTRISHLVTGGDFGWRGVTGSWPPYYPDHPDNARPNLDIGKGSPTSVMFGTKLDYPAAYRDALFALDWAYGRIVAVHLWRRGASYMMSAETFLKGAPLNVTDLAAGPDGAMYVITGGRGTQSALYRISYRGTPTNSQQSTEQARARREFADASHRKRRRLEALLSRDLPPAEEVREAWSALGDSDPWIRHAARNVVEQHPVSLWKANAFREPDLPTALQALTALARSGQVNPAGIVERLNELPWSTAQSELQAEAAFVYWLAARGSLPARVATETRRRIANAFPAESRAVDWRLSELIADLEIHREYESLLQVLERTTDRRDKLHYLFVLRKAKSMNAQQKERYLLEWAEATRFLGGRGLPDFVNRIREESIDQWPEVQGKLKSIVETLDSPPEPPARKFVKRYQIADLEDSLNFRVSNTDIERGRDLFVAAQCARCHRADSVGRAIGPDLTTVARRFSRRDMLISVLEPSKVIADDYRSLQLILKDGRTLTGRVATSGDYRSPELRIAIDPQKPFQFTSIRKNDIEQRRPSPTSWMPTGLLDTLTKQEIQQLLAYLESLSR